MEILIEYFLFSKLMALRARKKHHTSFDLIKCIMNMFLGTLILNGFFTVCEVCIKYISYYKNCIVFSVFKYQQ